jgi:hypothetical protein
LAASKRSVADHAGDKFALREDLIKQWIQGSLDGPATPDRKSEEKYTPDIRDSTLFPRQ